MGIKRCSHEMEGNIFEAAQTSISYQRRKVGLFKGPLWVVNVRKGQNDRLWTPQNEGCSNVGTMFEKPWPMMAQCQGMLALENTIEIMAVSTHYKLILYKELFYMFHGHSCPHCYLALTRWVPSFPLQQWETTTKRNSANYQDHLESMRLCPNTDSSNFKLNQRKTPIYYKLFKTRKQKAKYI